MRKGQHGFDAILHIDLLPCEKNSQVVHNSKNFEISIIDAVSNQGSSKIRATDLSSTIFSQLETLVEFL